LFGSNADITLSGCLFEWGTKDGFERVGDFVLVY
jgi:hypothetical protein